MSDSDAPKGVVFGDANEPARSDAPAGRRHLRFVGMTKDGPPDLSENFDYYLAQAIEADYQAGLESFGEYCRLRDSSNKESPDLIDENSETRHS